MTPREVLNDIATFDPDGGETLPTTNDYLNFEASVITQYGKQALDDYYRRYWEKEEGIYE